MDKNRINGISLGLSVIIISLLMNTVYVNKFNNKVVLMTVSLLCLFLGIAGLLIDLFKENEIGKDLGVGIFVCGIGHIISLIPFEIARYFAMFVYLLGLFAVFNGLINIANIKVDTRKKVKEFIAIIIALLGAIASAVQIIDFFYK